MRLKTKLVIAISAMVFALVTALSYVYLSQLLRQRMNEAYGSADFIAHQIYHGARDALEMDLSNTRVDTSNPDQVRAAIEESLQTDPGLNSLLQSIVGYSPLIYDAAITDVDGRALLHTDADSQGKIMRTRADFRTVANGGFPQQMRIIYGAPRVFEVDLPLRRDDKPFGEIRVGISTVFLSNELKPQLSRTFAFAAISIVVSFVLAAALSSFALRPMAAISARLDRISAGEVDTAPETGHAPTDEYGVVSTKINRLGQQIRDVKEVFSALKENLDQIMANLQDGLILFTQDSRIVLVSASAERFAGHARGEMLGHRVEEVFEHTNPLGKLVLDSFAFRQPVDQHEITTGNGRRVQVSLDFIEEGGERIGALLTMRDAESVHRIENEIELSRRLAAIGRLTSGVAHEVKNPINSIVVHLEVLREKLKALDPDSRRHMDIITSEIHRLDRVVQTLVDFTRPVELRLTESDLRKLVDDVALLASPEASRHNVTVERSLPATPLPARVDADLIKQALLNVVLNGVQAMPNGGALSITAGREDGTAWIDVRDHGGGIPPEIRDKIFNLYFTTKKAGTGIGLSMTYRVLQLHNGSVDFESKAGEGTVFHLRLPLVNAQAEAKASAEEAVRT